MQPQNIHIKLVVTLFFLAHIIFLNPFNVAAQETSQRPGVGLVLSGGGAHGIAHLGVIMVMEEAGLRPDYITGVSMGSIIGGMYSLGYRSDSLYKLLKLLNWKLLLSNNLPDNKVIFLEKEHFNNSIITLPLSSKKVMLPSGLINGQQVENSLSFYTWPAADINDFSKLPIPFLCLGTDIISYKTVELKTGYLADAIRASFSIPSIFTPLKIDTLLLLDGGLIRNFAANEVREMGADIVIGSYVGFNASKEEELQSVSGILKQIAMFRSLDDFEKQKHLVDVLILPEIYNFPITGFENVDSLIKKGYEAAMPYKEYFKRLADSLNNIAPQKPLENILEKRTYTFNKIEIIGNKNYSDQQIMGILDISPNEHIDKYQLTDKIDLLYGKAWFEKVKYKVVPRNDSLILLIDCTEKPKAVLYGSVHYDNSLFSGLILGVSVQNLLTQRSVINLNSFIGQYFRFKLNSIQFLDRNQKYGLSTNFYADNTMIPMLELRGDNGDVISRNFSPGLSISKRIGLNHIMRLSADYENLNLLLRYESDAHLKSLSYNYISATYVYQINTLDNKHFPNRGLIMSLSASTSKLQSGIIRTDSSKTVYKGYNSEFSFDRFFTFHGNFEKYFDSDNKFTFVIGGEVLLITDSDSVSAQNNFYLLGGIKSLNKKSIPMIGFHSNQIPVKKLAGVRAEIDLEIIKDLHINLMANVFAAQEFKHDNEFSLLTGYGLGIGYMSIIGPIRIGIMHGNLEQEKYFKKTKGYISIGYNF